MSQLPLTGAGPTSAILAPSFLWRDEFSDTVAAGALHRHAANPGPGTWYAADTNSKLSLGSGVANFATGGAAAADPAGWLPLTTRQAGRILLAEVTPADTAADHALVGWDTDQSGASRDAIKFSNTGLIQAVVAGTAGFTLGAFAGATSYQVALVMRANGMFWFIKGGTFTKWTLLWFSSNENDARYPSIQAAGTASVYTSDYIRCPTSLWTTISILASDSFARADGAVGSTDGLALAETGGSGLAWSAGSISSNALVITPTLGAEIHTQANAASDPNGNEANATTGWTSTGTLSSDSSAPHDGSYNIRGTGTGGYGQGLTYAFTGVVGQWYAVDLWFKTSMLFDQIRSWENLAPALTYTPAADDTWYRFKATVRATSIAPALKFWIYQSPETAEIDNLSIKPLTTASCVGAVETSKADVLIKAKVSVLTAYTQCGIAARLDSTSNPQNFILAYYDGNGNVAVFEYVNGVPAQVIAPTVIPFGWGAGDILALDLNGSAVRLYESRTLGGGGQQVVASGTTNVLTGTKHGIFSTDATNKVNSFVVLPKGSADEYIKLDDYTATPAARVSGWSEKMGMPTILADCPTAVYDGKIYVFGGYTPFLHSVPSNLTYCYDPATDSWTAKTVKPTAQWGGIAVTVGDKIHVFAGSGTDVVAIREHEIYDPVANTWDETKADTPADVGYQGLMGVAVSGKVHLFYKTVHYEYNPADDTYTPKAAVPDNGVTWGTCALVGTKIYIIAGAANGNAATPTNAVKIYDIAGNSWTAGAVMPDALYGATRENPVINGKIYVAHGQDENSAYYTTMYVYNPATDSWTTSPHAAAYARDGTGCGVVNNLLYIIGGRNGSVQYWWNEVFDPTI